MSELFNHSPALAMPDQYALLPYPPYDPAREAELLSVTRLDKLDKVSGYCFNGELDPRDGLRVLVAGGGTGETTIFLAEQLRDTPSEVVHLDISPSSIALARRGADVRGLSNIRWVHGSLLDLPDKAETFDYINCTGVLHQLEDPLEGLKALGSVLDADGAMALMVYGYYGRQDIYRLQEMLRGLNHDVTDYRERIANAQRALQDMPLHDWRHSPRNRPFVEEVQTDSGLYDLLLPKFDFAYTVPQVYEWLAAAGLQKVAFVDPLMGGELGYRPEAYLTDRRLGDQLAKLPEPQREYVAELASGEMIRHAFYAAKSAKRSASVDDLNIALAYSMSFDLSSQQAIQQLAEDRPYEPLAVTPLARHDRQVEVTFGKYGAALLRNINGLRSLGEVIEAAGAQTGETSEVLHRSFQAIYPPLHAADWLTLRHRKVAPWKTAHEIQQAWLDRRTPDKSVELLCFALGGLQRLVSQT